MQEEKVVLVDKNDNKLGLMPKMEAHLKGKLHRAFSVIIFNTQGKILLQKRASTKYHTPNLWSNTCCSHQRDGESNLEAGTRRLNEEMGFVCKLTETTSFIYKASFDNGLTEHEFDHVLVGNYNGEPQINTDEVASWKWMLLEDIKKDIAKNPSSYTAWFKIIFNKYYKHISS